MEGLQVSRSGLRLRQFLVITYRELRALELEILNLRHGKQRHLTLDEISNLSRLDVDQMYGIEIEEFPARIAEAACGSSIIRQTWPSRSPSPKNFSVFPCGRARISTSATHCGWNGRGDCAGEMFLYFGNPPFVGKHFRLQNKADIELVWDFEADGVLDFVCGWYLKAAEYIKGTCITAELYRRTRSLRASNPGFFGGSVLNLWHHDSFRHRTFAWESEASGKAHVHVVIVGFAAIDRKGKAALRIQRYFIGTGRRCCGKH